MAKQALLVFVLNLLVFIFGLPLSAQTDTFPIAYGDTVSDGVPGAGAGNLEVGGAQDIYTFTGTAGDAIILDVLAGSASDFRWSLAAPDSTLLFNGLYVDRQLTLSQTGSYTLTVYGGSASVTGTYSFRLLLPPPPQVFAISLGDTISDGVPASGAGNLEVDGAQDIYTFTGTAGDTIIFDVLVGSPSIFRWSLAAPNGTLLFNGLYTNREVTLSQTGSYTLTVYGGSASVTGIYSFRVLLSPAPDVFAISLGDTISDGVPAPGAGNLETPGAVDVYTFTGSVGQGVIFDALAGSNAVFSWTLAAPDGTTLFSTFLSDQQVLLSQTGTYTLTVRGVSIDNVGVYAFRLFETPASQQFAIDFGDTISDGVPASGAGNLESPGAVDIYTFDATAGQEAIFDALAGSNVVFSWTLDTPDGTSLFDTFLVDQQVLLDQTGTYTLTVHGIGINNVGVYAFRLLEASATQQFAIGFDQVVSDGDPARGAGNLEAPGAVDIYTFDAVAGQQAIFDVLAGNNAQIFWRLEAPDGTTIFDTFLIIHQVVLNQTGTYTLVLRGTTPDDFGTYAFALLSTFALEFDEQPPASVVAGGEFSVVILAVNPITMTQLALNGIDITLTLIDDITGDVVVGESWSGTTNSGRAEITVRVISPGIYRLSASASGISPVDSTPFEVTAISGVGQAYLPALPTTSGDGLNE